MPGWEEELGCRDSHTSSARPSSEHPGSCLLGQALTGARITGILPCPHSRPLASPSAADVKFISNPPSMVAAGSVVAAAQGLHLGSSNSFLSYHRLTRFLSKVIKCDPVSERAPLLHGQGRTSWSRGMGYAVLGAAATVP